MFSIWPFDKLGKFNRLLIHTSRYFPCIFIFFINFNWLVVSSIILWRTRDNFAALNSRADATARKHSKLLPWTSINREPRIWDLRVQINTNICQVRFCTRLLHGLYSNTRGAAPLPADNRWVSINWKFCFEIVRDTRFYLFTLRTWVCIRGFTRENTLTNDAFM